MSKDTLRRHLEAMRKRAVEVRANSQGKTQDVAAGFADGLQAAIEAIGTTAEPASNGDRWCVLVGNPLLGVSAHGPFLSFTEAVAWGERHASRSEFWVAPLVAQPAQAGPVLAVNNDEGLQ